MELLGFLQHFISCGFNHWSQKLHFQSQSAWSDFTQEQMSLELSLKLSLICCFSTETGKITLCVLVQLELGLKHFIATFLEIFLVP